MSTTTSSSTTTWPSWLPEPVYPIREKTIYPAIKTENKSPRPLARKKWPTPRKQWTLEWNEDTALIEEDYQSIRSFSWSNRDSSFEWTHPATNVTYTVILFRMNSNHQ